MLNSSNLGFSHESPTKSKLVKQIPAATTVTGNAAKGVYFLKTFCIFLPAKKEYVSPSSLPTPT